MKVLAQLTKVQIRMALTSNSSRLEHGIRHGYRSGLEEKVAEYILGKGILASYEPIRIPYLIKRTSTYTPDFVTLSNGIVIETKGRFLSKDRQKHLIIKRQYPELDLRFVFTNPRARLNKTSKTTYAAWCEKHGFQWAAKLPPEEWLEEPPNEASIAILEELGLDMEVVSD